MLQSFIDGKLAFEDDKPIAKAITVEAGSISVSGMSMVDFSKVPKNSVLVLPVHNVITKYGNICMWGSNDIGETLAEAAKNPNVIGAVLDIDSGGGSVDGISPAINGINIMKEAGKPVVAWADTMASAAFYIGASTSYIYAQNDISSEFGSVGVMVTFEDIKPALEKEGRKRHEIYSSLSTAKNQPFIQALKGEYDLITNEVLDPIAIKFQADVQEFRPNMSTEGDVLQGKMYYAKEALSLGMIDGIGSLQDAIDKVIELADSHSMASNKNSKPNSKTNTNTMKDYKQLLAILALSMLEFSDGVTSLSKEQVETLQAEFKKRAGKDLELENLEFDAENYASFTEDNLVAINKMFLKYPEATEPVANQQENAASADLAARMQKLEETNAKLQENLKALGNQPEKITLEQVDKVIRMVDKKDREMVIAQGFVFGENNPWNKVDSARPWNQALEAKMRGDLNAMNIHAATEVDISQLETDLGLFISGRKGEIMEWFAPNDQFNSIFPTVTGVKEGDFFVSVDLQELSQQYQKGWTPKGGYQFYDRKPRLFDIKFDQEFENLKAIERTWLNDFNREGSDAYKMTFVEYLVSLVLKKALLEYQIAAIKGEYKDPTTGVAGYAMNILDGILLQINNFESELIAKPFNIGEWTSVNILTFTSQMISALPEYVRNRPNLGFYAASEFVKTYWEQRRIQEGTMPTYDPSKSTIPGYDNIRLITVPNEGNSKRVFITPIGNIRQLMGERDGNSSIVHIETSKRIVNVFADYKRAIWPTVVGVKSANAQALADRDYNQQIIWYNNADIPSTEYLTVDPDMTELSAKRHNMLETPANTVATAITDITDVATGEVVTIKCGALTNASTIADAGNFDLASAWNPTTVGETITLVKRSGGTFIEVSRDDAIPDVTKFTADDATPSVDGGQYFITVDNTGALAITDLDDAVAGTTYYIYGGGGATHTATIADAGNFDLTAAWTATAGAELHLYYTGSKFIEIDRVTP